MDKLFWVIGNLETDVGQENQQSRHSHLLLALMVHKEEMMGL
jgi:hypothetical protein